jgi:sodium/proline symporter
MVGVSRILVGVVAAVGFAVAVYKPPGVFAIVIFTTSVLGSAFLPAYVCAVWWRKGNTPGALASMVGGACVSLLWKLVGLEEATAVHPMFAGVAVSTTLMVVVSLATQRSHPVPEHVLKAMNRAAQVARKGARD